ncbi:MAG TPA: hypothetical protein VHC19_08160 [Pirellulales bacterium]|nr:hypothetical protein [Pirellulales bacterium]
MQASFPGTETITSQAPVPVVLKDPATRKGSVPSEREILRRAAEIRRSWTAEERRRRAVSDSSWELVSWLLGIQSHAQRNCR